MRRILHIAFTLCILISLLACKKFKPEKAPEQLLGRWEIVKFEVDDENKTKDFESSDAFVEHIIFYPTTSDHPIYYKASNGVDYYGEYVLDVDNKTLTSSYQTHTNGYMSVGTYSCFPWDRWDVIKLNNNRMILEATCELTNVDFMTTRITLKKTGVFE